MSNVLYDPQTNKITGLVDFDFASVGHPCQEFFSSFHDVSGNAFSDGTAEGKTWEDALAARGILRPSTIRGMETLTLLGKLDGLLCPFRLAHAVSLSRNSPDQIAEERAKAERELVGCLNTLGA
jgi:aminoglycoside phosphotransferase (APT) family kinase protein